ncbi:MAG TPA: DUF1569 domain-containing protein [Gemmatimonadales bacterium]|nr:DUF1569 domain-containing protein [Gemmatimonadales bacterium]
MRNLFDQTAATEFRTRIGKLTPANQRQWGKMTAPQAVAHCANALEMALGEIRPPREFAGRILGPLVKRIVLGNDARLRPGAPTSPSIRVDDDRDLDSERLRLLRLLDRFSAAGSAGCTTHPHPFFGALTSEQWSILMYKHLDHHLRQFGV